MLTHDAPPIDRVELVCLEHVDIGFTAAPQEVARREKEHLDHAIALCRERTDFRWTIESIWQLEQWLARTTDPGERDELIAFVRDGRIEVAGGFANFHTAMMDAELVLRCFEPADAIRRDLGISIKSCVQDDVPGFCALFPTAMAQDGIRYFLAGVNTTFGGATSLGPGRNPFWWEGLDGSRVLTWVAYGSYVEAENLGLGVWSRDGEADAKLVPLLQLLAGSGYAFPRVLAMAATGDNGDPDAARSILRKVDAWNATHATPKIGFTTPGAFLTGLERDAIRASGRDDGGFPVVRGDWSGHWEPVKVSAPAAMALVRDAQALLPGAEALSLRASRELGRPYPQHDLDQALRDLLLCAEHSRPNGVGWPKLTTKADVEAAAQFDFAPAFRANETLHALVARATDAYAERLSSDGASRVVANPTPFTRDSGLGGAVEGWAFRHVPIAAPAATPAATAESAAAEMPPADLFTFCKSGFGGELAPLELTPAALARNGFRAAGATRAGPATTTSIELAIDHTVDAAHDPLRLYQRVQPLGPPRSADSATTTAPPDFRFTTAAGVVTTADFLPGSLPTSFCTTGAIELRSHGDGANGRVATLLLREPFAFETTAPRYLGSPDLADPGTLWIRLLERAVRGETRDQDVVEFLRLEPTADERRTFHLSCAVSDAATDDADLMRQAWAWRAPLITREFTPWFAPPPSDVGTRALVTTRSDRVLVLSCRPDGDAVLVRVQEVGGVADPAVTVTLALPGVAGSQTVPLRAHEVRTLRFEPSSGR